MDAMNEKLQLEKSNEILDLFGKIQTTNADMVIVIIRIESARGVVFENIEQLAVFVEQKRSSSFPCVEAEITHGVYCDSRLFIACEALFLDLHALADKSMPLVAIWLGCMWV